MADNRLYCPLLTAGHLANSETGDEPGEKITCCMLDDCAWYVEEGCAVKALTDIKTALSDPAR